MSYILEYALEVSVLFIRASVLFLFCSDVTSGFCSQVCNHVSRRWWLFMLRVTAVFRIGFFDLFIVFFGLKIASLFLSILFAIFFSIMNFFLKPTSFFESFCSRCGQYCFAAEFLFNSQSNDHYKTCCFCRILSVFFVMFCDIIFN